MDGLIMCLVGGMQQFFGPVIGAFLITVLTTQLSIHTQYYQMVLGIIVVFCVLFLRGGILGGGPKVKQFIAKFKFSGKTGGGK